MDTNQPVYHILSFYKFIDFSQDDLLDLKKSLEQLTENLHTRGLILIGKEGINATISGEKSALSQIKSFLDKHIGKSNPVLYKENLCDFLPFKRMKVKLREEIIKMKPMHPDDIKENSKYLSSKQWHQALKENKGVFLDVRNWYETQIGTFEGAQVLNIENFADFMEAFKKLNVDKNQPIYTFCTGGIRCEKANVEMQKMGYQQTYQLKGGILDYLQNYVGDKDNKWQGECFVFDHRVAVDKSMQPSKVYCLCPHCGQPGKNILDCKQCGQSTKVCDFCLKSPQYQTCSKNCAYHYQNKQLPYLGEMGT